MSNYVNRRSVRKVTQVLGSYFNQGQVTYALCVDGVNHVAEGFYFNPLAYGVPADVASEIQKNDKPEKYIIDYIFENATHVDYMSVYFKEKALLDPLKSVLEGKIENVELSTKDSYAIIVGPEGGAEETEAPAVTTAAPQPMTQLPGKAQYLHVGIPVTDKKPNMIYLNEFKVWITRPEDYDFKIEYLKYMEGTPFPSILHKNPHVAYMVEDMKPYMDQAQQVLFGPAPLNDEIDFSYILMDDTIFELQAKRK